MLIRRRIFTVLAALIVLLGFAIGPASATPAAAAETCFYIAPNHSGHYLDVEGGSSADGARIIQWYRSFTSNQRWKFIAVTGSPDTYYIQSVASGKVLSVNSYVAGSPVIQWTNTAATSQQWLRVITGNGSKYRNVATGMYLDVSGYSYAVGAPLVQWPQTEGSNQVFSRTDTSC